MDYGASALLPPGAKLPRVLVWFRRDLRLEDNPALTAALEIAEEVIPIFIYATEEEGQFQPGRCSRWWLSSSLRSLDTELQALGSRLLRYRAPESCAALITLVRDLGGQAVFFNHLYDPISMVRDNEVKAALGKLGVLCQSFMGDVLREPWEVLDQQGQPFTSFDEFWAGHCATAAVPPTLPLPAPAVLPSIPACMAGAGHTDLGVMTPDEELSNAQLEYHWSPGTDGARRLLSAFIDGGRLQRFDADRAKTDRASTSKLSPHIHFGEISVRSVAAAATAAAENWGPTGGAAAAAFLRQLGYRDYSRYLSFHFPFTHERSLLEHLRAVPWRFDHALFKAWRTGTCGYPLVDAGMREVWSTGWMHNRIRVVAASFMVKQLLLPWQWGLKHYWDALLDADLECDALGWQYCAGCLMDAHPLSYMMDLAVEAKNFDPDGNYIRRWLPVLARLPTKYIHAPWEAPSSVLESAGVELGVNYPWPVVDPKDSAEALAAVIKVVEGAETKPPPGVTFAPGPFRPATQVDPDAAVKLWGAAVAREVSATAAGGTGGTEGRQRATPSGKSTGEALGEEGVESNALSTGEDEGDGAEENRAEGVWRMSEGERRDGADGGSGEGEERHLQREREVASTFPDNAPSAAGAFAAGSSGCRALSSAATMRTGRQLGGNAEMYRKRKRDPSQPVSKRL